MNMRRVTSFVAASWIGLMSTQALASGFQVGEMATRAMGMSNAFTAVADDPSSQWYNPAGSAFLNGTQMMVGGDLVLVPSIKFTTNASNPAHPASASSKSKTIGIPHFYLTHSFEGAPLTLGIGVNSPFGLETDWPGNSPFATSNTFSQLKTVNVNPNASWRISDHLAVAIGVDYVRLMKVRLNNSLQLLEGKGDGWGGNVALLYRNDKFRAGLSYRSRVRLDIKNGTVIGGPDLAKLGAGFAVGARGTARTRVVLPDQLYMGIAYRPNEQWLLSLDVDWVNWKTFDNLDFFYAPSTVATVITGGTNFRSLRENWSAGFAVRVGTEWTVQPGVKLRAGYTFDPTPVDQKFYTPGIPDRDRHLATLGVGYDVNDQLTFDAAYMLVYFVDRNQTASTGTDAVRNGNYSGNVHIFGGSLTYRF